MTESEKELIHEIAVDEFKKRWLLGSIWLFAMIAVAGFAAYGACKAIFG
jgi:hypothetical protein